jgi:chromosomal replication initiation ATPase DnaA
MTKQLPPQLSFLFENKTFYSIYDIVIGYFNKPLIDLLFKQSNWLSNVVFIYGQSSLGKTFISKIFIEHNNGIIIDINRLDIIELDNLTTQYSSFLIDNLSVLDSQSQTKLFHLYNLVVAKKKKLLLNSTYSINDLNLQLQDLKSRLLASNIFYLKDPDEETLKAIFFKMLSDKQLLLNKDVITYIFHRIPRNIKSIIDIAIKIEDFTMNEKKTITIKNIHKILD